jgi:two-component system sensor histidine kinase RegB
MERPSLALLDPRSNPWHLAEGHNEGSMWLAWLVRLRWVAIFAQLVTLSSALGVIDHAAIVVPMLVGAVGFLVLTNLTSIRILHDREAIQDETLLGQLIGDVAVLTVFFLAAGGPTNPFVMLYVVHVAMASVMLPARYALVVSLQVVLSNLLLHAWHLPLHPDRHSLPAPTLLAFGQTIALTVTVASVGAFVMGMATTLRRQKHRLLVARERAARTDRLRSVGTLAAGAAHELNTPLSTIGLRLRRVGRRHEDADTVRDLDVMQRQLDRCTQIVQQLLVGAGDPSASGLERAPLHEFVAQALKLWDKSTTLQVQFVPHEREPIEVELPKIAFTQAFINLLENARQAQEAIEVFEPLIVEVRPHAVGGEIVLSDAGAGLPAEADRVGEPFFTTKPNGTGLGVFVARAVAEGAGGGLRYDRVDGRTLTRWWFRASERVP